MYESPPPIRTPSVGWMLANLVWWMTLHGGAYGLGAGAVYGLGAGVILDFSLLGAFLAGMLFGAIAGMGLGFCSGWLIGAIAWRWFRPLRDPGRFRVVAQIASAGSVVAGGALLSLYPLSELLAGTTDVIKPWLLIVVGPTVIGCGLAWRAAGKASAWYERFSASSPRQ